MKVMHCVLLSTKEEVICAIKKKVLTEINPNAIMFLEISSKGALYEKL